jgi:hypothetical protein
MKLRTQEDMFMVCNVHALLAIKRHTFCHPSIILHRSFICTLRLHYYGD